MEDVIIRDVIIRDVITQDTTPPAHCQGFFRDFFKSFDGLAEKSVDLSNRGSAHQNCGGGAYLRATLKSNRVEELLPRPYLFALQ